MKRVAFLLSALAVGTLLGADWPAGPAKKHAYLEVDGALTFTIGATNVTVTFKKIDRR